MSTATSCCGFPMDAWSRTVSSPSTAGCRASSSDRWDARTAYERFVLSAQDVDAAVYEWHGVEER